MRAEYLSEKGFMNIGHQIFLPEGKAVTFDFFLTHRDGGNELSQQSMHGMHRDFPNTEETKNMVNPVCIEVFRHFLKTLHPPTITILFHNVPVVGRKSPILSVYREVVGRGTRLSVEVEVMRFGPCFHTIAADTDRNISFECDTVFAGIFRSGYQLQVQMKLNIKIECDMRIIYRFRLTHLLYILSIINSMSGPFAEIRRLEGVAQITENRIRLQPFLVGFKEFSKLFGSQYFFSFLLEDQAEVLPFGLIDSFIINRRQTVKFFLSLIELG